MKVYFTKCKEALKEKPKIYISNPPIRNAVSMIDNLFTDSKELGITVETAVFKYVNNFYSEANTKIGYFRKSTDNQKEIDIGVEFPNGKSLIEMKFKENSTLAQNDSIVEMCHKGEKI